MGTFASYMTGHVMDALRRLVCALRGHEDYLQFEKNRMYLHCISCGHDSPGWTVGSRRPALRFEARRGPRHAQDFVRKTA